MNVACNLIIHSVLGSEGGVYIHVVTSCGRSYEDSKGNTPPSQHTDMWIIVDCSHVQDSLIWFSTNMMSHSGNV